MSADAPETSSSTARPRGRIQLSWRKKLLFAVLTCAVFFGGLELLLALLGVRPVLYESDPYVGFSSRIPLFVEKKSADGTVEMATADSKLNQGLFNDQRFQRKKEPGTFRIFSMGGSTTYGHPYDDRASFSGWMREFLPVIDPSRKWEVINAGGVSYGSYRVAMLMEELIQYEPDLFVIYCGQNEFLERRTYSRLIEMPEVVRGLGALASHTRTWAALSRLIDRKPSSTSSRQTEVGAVTQLPAEVSAILDQSVGPDAYTRDDTFRTNVFAHYRYSLFRMVDIAESVGARVIFVTPASNLRDCSPFKSEHTPGLHPGQLKLWQQYVQQAQQAQQTGQMEQCLAALDRAVAINPRHAATHFHRAKALDALKRIDEAKQAYQRACEEDVCTIRAVGRICEMVAEVASAKQAPLVDFVGIVKSRAADGIPGNDLFLDHVHPTIEMNRVLALALMETMRESGWLRPKDGLPEAWAEAPEIQQVTQLVESRMDRLEHGAALRRLAMVLSWAGKFEEAMSAGKRAIELNSEDLEAHYQFARCAQVLGKADEAAAHYELLVRQEVDMQTAPIYFAEACNNLGVILEKRGQISEAMALYSRAAQRPNFAPAHYNQGILFKRLGDLANAEKSFRSALRVQPDFAEAWYSLGLLVQAQGKLAEAAGHYRRALELRPGYASAAARLAELRQQHANQ